MNEQVTYFLQQYQHLSAMLAAGKIHPQQFMAEVQKLRWQDAHGIWWMIDPNGALLRYNGQRWLPVQAGPAAATPQPVMPSPPPSTAAPFPAVQPQSAVPSPPPGAPMPQAPGSSPSTLRNLLPILPIVPSLLCGGLWFLYTFLGLFKYEGVGGVDFVTPMIVGGLPLLFWVLKKPLDQLLSPLKPAIQSVPRPVRLGVCLAIPIFLGFGCSLFSSSGYLALNVSAFISVMTAGLLLRY